MKKLLRISVMALLVSAASPALAQSVTDVTGTVNITGTVAPKCIVTPGAGDAFNASVALGELAQADGRVDAAGLPARFLQQGGAALQARVVCTTAAPTISVDATEITSPAPVVSGYTNRVDFTANVAVTTVTGSGTFSNNSAGGALAATPIGGRLANNGGNNIAITASNFSTANPDALLVAADDYTGRIVVVIAPGA